MRRRDPRSTQIGLSEISLPLISVVIPVYNGAAFLRDALGSVRAQTYRPLEVIVVDDGSSDDSGDIARSFTEVKYVHQTNRGIAAARNRGVSLVSGEMVAFIDQDDTWAPNKLERQFDYLNAHSDVDLVLAHERLVFADGYHSSYWANHTLMAADHVSVVPGVWLVRRSLLDVIGAFDGSFTIADDFDWLMRVLDSGARHGVVEETMLFKRLHGTNASFRLGAAKREILTAIRASIQRRRRTGTSRS